MPSIKIMIDEDGMPRLAVMISIRDILSALGERARTWEPLVVSTLQSMAGEAFQRGKKKKKRRNDDD